MNLSTESICEALGFGKLTETAEALGLVEAQCWCGYGGQTPTANALIEATNAHRKNKKKNQKKKQVKEIDLDEHLQSNQHSNNVKVFQKVYGLSEQSLKQLWNALRVPENSRPFWRIDCGVFRVVSSYKGELFDREFQVKKLAESVSRIHTVRLSFKELLTFPEDILTSVFDCVLTARNVCYVELVGVKEFQAVIPQSVWDLLSNLTPKVQKVRFSDLQLVFGNQLPKEFLFSNLRCACLHQVSEWFAESSLEYFRDQKIQELDFSQVKLVSPTTFGQLQMLLLKVSRTLTFLSLKHCDLSIRQFRDLSPLFSECNGLLSLNLQGNSFKFEEPQDREVFSFLETSRNLISLDLSNCAIADDEMHAILSSLDNSKGNSLETLILSRNELAGPGFAEILAQVLRTNKTLKTLDVSWNYILTKSMIPIAEALSANFTLTFLDFSMNEPLRSKAFSVLAASLVDKPNLCSLLIGCQGINAESLSDICSALTFSSNLKQLSFSYANIGENGATAILASCLSSKFFKLTYLDLSFCHLKSEDVTTVLEACESQMELDTFLIDQNPVDSTSILEFKEFIKSRPCIHTFSFPWRRGDAIEDFSDYSLTWTNARYDLSSELEGYFRKNRRFVNLLRKEVFFGFVFRRFTSSNVLLGDIVIDKIFEYMDVNYESYREDVHFLPLVLQDF
jgi:Ran GTPase-activating protein (RanGAP) involved in mRNA processing and transport